MSAETTYSLWWKPSGAAYDALARTIGELAQALDAPAFEPHVTLLGNLDGTEEEHVQRSEALARRLQPVQIVLTEPSCGDTYFQCVFMLVRQTPPVMSAHALAEQAFGGRQETYLPHVSLLYGYWPDARKKHIIERLPPDVRISFQAGSVHLIKAGSADPKDWQEIAAFPMTG